MIMQLVLLKTPGGFTPPGPPVGYLKTENDKKGGA